MLTSRARTFTEKEPKRAGCSPSISRTVGTDDDDDAA